MPSLIGIMQTNVYHMTLYIKYWMQMYMYTHFRDNFGEGG